MQIKQLFLCIILIGTAISGVSARQQQYTLAQSIEIALENNRNIKQQELSRQQREIEYNSARAELLPGLNASAGQNFIFGRSIGSDNIYQMSNSTQTSLGVTADITLFDGMRMKHNIDSRKSDLNASEADLEKMREDIVMSVTTAFLRALMNRELLNIAENQVVTTEADLKRRSILVAGGKLAEGELYEIEAQLAGEELKRVEAETNLKLALLDLAQIMEIEDFNDFNIIAPPTEQLINETLLLTSEAVYESALLHLPEIRSMQHQVESSRKAILVAKSQFWPTLSFGVNMGTGYYNMNGRDNDSFSSQLRSNISNTLGFNLRIPIFNRFQIRNNLKSAQLNLSNSRLEMDKRKNELRKEIEQAYWNALGAESRWVAAQKSVTASNEAYRFAEEKYNSGRVNSYELFFAKNNQTNALGEEIQAKYEYAFRLKILELLKD